MRPENWWAHHTEATVLYTIAAREENEAEALHQAGALAAAIVSWSGILSKKTGSPERGLEAAALMAEHTVAAKILADRGFVGDTTCFACSIGTLRRNRDAQVDFLGKAVPGFPTAGFQLLFRDHINLLIDYMGALARMRTADFESLVERAKANAAELDVFTRSALL